MPDQSQQNESSPAAPSQQGGEPTTGNPSDTSANSPAAATSESQASNVNRASEGQQVQAAQTIEGDPTVGKDNYEDENAWPYRALQQEAKSRDLGGDGKREELVARLREHDAGGGRSDDGVARSSVPAPVVENGGISRTDQGQRHAEVLQGLSDERRAQQLGAVKDRASRTRNDSAE